MLRYLLIRIARALAVVLCLSAVVFLLAHLIPGDPATLIAGENSTPELRAQITRELGLDQPVWSQYLSWLGHAVRGDLGTSLLDGQSVAAQVSERLPVSLELAVYAAVIAAVWGIPAGIWSAMHQGRAVDRLVNGTAFLGLAFPPFVVGTVMVLLVSRLTPGWPLFSFVPFDQDPLLNLQDLLLPAVALGIPFGATLCRYMRAAVLDVVGQDFMRTAAAKGAGRRRLMLRHALRNALVPVVTAGGLQLGVLVGGTVIVEQVFALPGLGSLIVSSITQHDFTVVQGAVLALGASYVVINLVTDLLYPLIDPRIRTTGARRDG
ncbi:ABC transporter permease [Streptomyces hyaluromycini]|uniref:ABC transporter permease n=1 Tax=Streptomyces hyaluromycini TaxID=1377993 RepID=UPI000B5C3CCF|nr:ABC transporter permease [Streptomyces hyaluromycini]